MGQILGINCAEADHNTGYNGCPIEPGLFKGAILVPKAKRFTQAEIAVMEATLQALTLAVKADRAYPIGEFKGITDNTEDVSFQTLGYGSKRLNREGKYDWTFMMTSGIMYNNKLRKFNNNDKYSVLFYDNQMRLYGISEYNTVAAEYQLGGFSLDFVYTYPFKAADGSNPAEYKIRFALADPKELNDNVYVIQLDFDPADTVKGNIDISISSAKTVGVKKLYVKLVTVEDGVNLYDQYNGELDAAGAWSLVDATGAVVTPSAVAADPTCDGFEISLSAGATITITTVSAAALAALGVGGAPENGYECIDSYTVVVPNA